MTLKRNFFHPLAVDELQPTGWLRRQLEIQAEGLTGSLDKFWPDIKDSKWIGGTTDGWERLPYWLDGFIPLAWLLDNEDMKTRAHFYMDQIISRQADDGWICPEPEQNRSQYDLWAFFLVLKVLVIYHDMTGDERIERVVRKALQYLDRHLDSHTLFGWAQTRWFECLIAIYWLYERIGEQWLLYLASKLNAQGFDWLALFHNWPYQESDGKGRWSFMSHVVNNAMAIKSGPLLWRLTGADAHLAGAEQMLALLDQHHGMVTGVFSGDECLAGTSPISGTELCAVVEFMYSLEQLLSITGNSSFGDRLERIAYNALPAACSPDMWSHQYDQQVNQAECSSQEDPVFTTNNGESHLFGLEPNFGCCTANMHQGWPKFAMSTFMRTADGLAATAYAPCTVTTKMQDASVEIILETDYPFRDTLSFQIKTDKPISFALWLRIPEWAEGASIEKNKECLAVESAKFHKIYQEWAGETEIILTLPAKPALIERPNSLYAVVRGPLVYALSIGEQWKRIHADEPFREMPHADYEIYPTTPWNYSLCLDPACPDEDIHFSEYPLGAYPFSPEGAPIRAAVKGRQIDWPIKNGSALPSPTISWVSETVEDLVFIPYGCTNLRMTEMPLTQE